MKPTEFSSIEINKSLPAPLQCLINQIQVQKPIKFVATNQMPITFRVASRIINIDSNITDTIKPVEDDHSWDHSKVVVLDRWSSCKTPL